MPLSPAGALTETDNLRLHDHACWVSDNSNDQRMRLARYLGAGLSRGERVGYYGASAARNDAAVADLSAAGVSVGELTARGQLILGLAESEYVRGPTFDPQARLKDYATAVRECLDSGYQGLRVAADVTWLRGHPDAQRTWPGYELGADLLAARLPFTALCLYERQDWQPQQLALIEALHSLNIRSTPREVTAGFSLRAERDGSIRLTGELDLTYAGEVGEALAVAVQHNRTGVLDVTDLRFVDVAGLRAIAATCHAMIRSCGKATIRGASPMFGRMWRLAEFPQRRISIEVM